MSTSRLIYVQEESHYPPESLVLEIVCVSSSTVTKQTTAANNVVEEKANNETEHCSPSPVEIVKEFALANDECIKYFGSFTSYVRSYSCIIYM